jgi:hypothetical protein
VVKRPMERTVPVKWEQHTKLTRDEVLRWLDVKGRHAAEAAEAWGASGKNDETALMHALYALAFQQAAKALRSLARKRKK